MSWRLFSSAVPAEGGRTAPGGREWGRGEVEDTRAR